MIKRQLDTTMVKCPNGCIIDSVNGGETVTNEFRFMNGEIGQRNYCCRCGKKLVEVDAE